MANSKALPLWLVGEHPAIVVGALQRAGRRFIGSAGQANYAAAKAGVLGFTKSLAREVGSRNITVNAVAPGWIETDMTRNLPEAQRQALLDAIPLHRPGEPRDIAKVVAFLASADAAYLTGETLHVNGGMYMA